MSELCKRRVPLVLRDVRIVNEGTVREGAVLIDVSGRIEQISSGNLSLDRLQRYEVVEANGQYLFPGVIDTHVHFRDPGFTHKGDLQSESRAAVAGGVTSYCDMPNTKPQTTTMQAVRDKLALASGRSYANYAFYLGASVDNLDEIRRCDANRVPAIKLFMGASTGGMQLTLEEVLSSVFRESPLLIATHCETDSIIAENLQTARASFPQGIPFSEHARIRSVASCVESVKLAQRLAESYQARLHVLHLSSLDEVALFADEKLRSEGKITCETCPHYLYFSDSDYGRLEWRIKCNPSIKAQSDRAALISALKSGIIRTIGTDHAPHLMCEKVTDYEHSPSGIPSIQYSLVLMLSLAEQENLSFPSIVELMSHAPSRLFGVQGRGYIREGYFADLVLVDRCSPYLISSEGTESKCGWSPYDGLRMPFCVRRTLVNGRTAYSDINGVEEPFGMPLLFNANRRDGKFV